MPPRGDLNSTIDVDELKVHWWLREDTASSHHHQLRQAERGRGRFASWRTDGDRMN
jgi:hypothetical protein